MPSRKLTTQRLETHEAETRTRVQVRMEDAKQKRQTKGEGQSQSPEGREDGSTQRREGAATPHSVTSVQAVDGSAEQETNDEQSDQGDNENSRFSIM